MIVDCSKPLPIGDWREPGKVCSVTPKMIFDGKVSSNPLAVGAIGPLQYC